MLRVLLRRRIDDNGLELFFVNHNPRGFWVEGYSRESEHFQCPRGYIRYKTKPVLSSDIQAQNFVRAWATIGELIPVKIVEILRAPRALRRLGD